MSNKKKGVEFDSIKKKLIDRMNELQLELIELNVNERGDQVLDSGDQAQSVSRETLRISIQNEGSYGMCVDCEQPIPEKRLKHFANATRCLVCQERYEESKPR